MRDEKQQQELHRILDELRKPFHPSNVIWKPGAVKGERAMALAYADLRAYMNRLDDVCGADWSVAYEPWGDDRIICRLTILDVTRSSTGEMSKESERSEIGGTVAEAQAMKRAAAMFGMGRSLYDQPTTWVAYDPQSRRITDSALKTLLASYTAWYKRELAKGPQKPVESPTEADGTPPHQRLWGQGMSVFGPDWDMARPWLIAKWSAKVSPDNTRNSASELNDDERDQLADYIKANAKALQGIWVKQKGAMLQST